MKDLDARAFPLIEAIYEAGVEPARWNDVVRGVSETFGDATVGMALVTPGLSVPPHVYAHRQSAEYRKTFARHWGRGLPWGSFLDPVFSQHFSRANQTLPDELVAGTDYYREWMEPQGLLPEAPVIHIMGIEEGIVQAGIAIYRRVDGREFDGEDLALADRLVAHLATAYEVHRSLSEARAQRRALSESIDRLPTGILLLDAKLCPAAINRSAQQILALEDGLSLVEGVPRAAEPEENRVLQRHLETAATRVFDEDSGDGAALLTLSRPSGKRPLNVMVASLLPAPEGAMHSDAVVSLYITDPEAVQITTAEVLKSLYQLTPAEAELVKLLTNGHSLEDSAVARGVTVNTARTQLKQVFAKTETRRQGELVRLVLTGVAAIRDG